MKMKQRRAIEVSARRDLLTYPGRAVGGTLLVVSTLSFLLALAAEGSAATTTVDAPAAAYELHWEAPPECATASELRGRLDALSVPGRRASPLRIEAKVHPERELRLELRLGDESPRSFAAEGCPVLAETLVVLSAVALGSPIPLKPLAIGAETPRLHARKETLAASSRNNTEPPRKQQERDHPGPTSRGRRFEIELAAGMSTGLGSDSLLGSPTGEAAFLYHEGFLRLGLRASLLADTQRGRSSSDVASHEPASLQLQRWTIIADLCGGGALGRSGSRWEAYVCADLGPSLWLATAPDLSQSATRRTVQWLLGAALRAGYRVTRRWTVLGSGRLEHSVPRVVMNVKEPITQSPVTVHESPNLSTTWTLGLGYSF
jgi:hypothetical protein